jgi:gliding motility-associated-like protein
LYLIGTTTPANNGIASLNCHQSNFGGGLRDAYIAKFRDCLPFTHIITQDTIKACGDSVLVSATSGLASYSWSNGKTTASFFAKSTGWYKLTATNSAGCPGTDSVFVSILKANILNNDTAICAGQSVKLSVDSVLAGAQFAQCAPLPSNLQNGLVGFWPFCGNANDLSGNGNNGTVNGATLTSDRFGNTNSAYSFDGINDYINTNQIGNTISNKTFSVWVSLNTLLQSGGGAVSIDNGNNFDAIVYNELNNGWIFGSDHFTRTSTTNFLEQNNQWVHLVYSYAPYNFKIYRNGLLIHQNSNFNVFTFQSTSFFSFGRRHTNGAITNTVGPINSKLDDIAIWNRALSPQEIQQLYNSSYLPKYLWSTGDTTPTINVTPSVTTKYWVRVSNGSHFCTDTVTVTVNNPPVNLITQDTIKACGDSVLVSATSGLASYSWSNSKTTTSFFAKSTGWYKVTATNSAGCPGTDSVFVSILKANIRNNDTAICAGQSVKLSADSLLAGAQFAQCAPLPSNLQNGLVGFWPFCGNANDVSGNGNNGTVNGATLTADRFGNMNNSYIFNGVSNKIEIPATSAFDVLQFTISYWLNTNSSANQHLVSKSNWSNAASEMFCTYLTSSQICFEVKKNSSCVGGNGWNKVSSNLPSNFLSNWHLLTYSYDGTNMKFYLNGTLLNSSTLIGPIDLCSGGQLKIGAWWSSHTLYYSGKIDDMSFWNRALNSQEIQQLYTPAYPQTYLWSTGDTTPAVNVTPSVTTKYWVRVSNGSHFCTDTFTVTVDTNTRSTINQTICQGQSLLGRTVSGVYIDTLIGANNKGCDSIRTLNLTVNDTTKKDSFRTICKNYPVLFNGLWIKNSGTYKDTLVNTNGCDSFLYLHLTVNDTTKKDSLRTICKNYPVLFNGLWRNNSGTYKDTLVNAYGCDSFLYLHLTVNDTTKKDSFRTICKNHPVLFNGLWINNSGTYKDTLVNANGCDSFIYLYLKVDTIPISNAGINKSRVNCAGDSVQIGTMPNANYAYSWSPNLFLSDNNTAQPWVKTQTSTNYILIVTDNNTNCQSRDTVEVNVIANNLDATKQVKHIRCFGENNGEVTIKGINGYTDYSYKIGTGNFIDSGTYKNLAPGIIPYTVKDSKGCLYSDTFLITEPLLLKIDTTLKKNILCYRGEDGEIQVLVSGGNNPYNYNWSSSPLNLPKIGNLKAGTYHITITDKNGCIINRSFDLIQPDAIKLGDTLIQKNICNGDSMASIDVSIIGGVGQYEYIWSNGDKSKKVTNLKQGHYSLTVTDSAKCTQKYQFSIMDYPKLIFDTILSLNFNCDNEGAIILSAKGGLPNYSYSIDSGINFSSNKRFKVEEASAYQVQIKDNNGCIIKSSTKVRGSKRIEIEAYPKETITLPGEPITLGFNYTKGDSRNVQSILWKPSDGLSCTDCANPIATPYTPMQYSVTIFYNNLCSATEVINIRHTNQNSELFIPNSFFPESSNPENQTFKIYSNHLQKATLKIFNRWGEKVFESNNAQNIGWDGTYKGEPMKTAVYIYWAEVTYLDGRKVIKSGDLTLIR